MGNATVNSAQTNYQTRLFQVRACINFWKLEMWTSCLWHWSFAHDIECFTQAFFHGSVLHHHFWATHCTFPKQMPPSACINNDLNFLLTKIVSLDVSKTVTFNCLWRSVCARFSPYMCNQVILSSRFNPLPCSLYSVFFPSLWPGKYQPFSCDIFSPLSRNWYQTIRN